MASSYLCIIRLRGWDDFFLQWHSATGDWSDWSTEQTVQLWFSATEASELPWTISVGAALASAEALVILKRIPEKKKKKSENSERIKCRFLFQCSLFPPSSSSQRWTSALLRSTVKTTVFRIARVATAAMLQASSGVTRCQDILFHSKSFSCSHAPLPSLSHLCLVYVIT